MTRSSPRVESLEPAGAIVIIQPSAARMGLTAFHRHFKQMISLTPGQYQKAASPDQGGADAGPKLCRKQRRIRGGIRKRLPIHPGLWPPVRRITPSAMPCVPNRNPSARHHDMTGMGRRQSFEPKQFCRLNCAGSDLIVAVPRVPVLLCPLPRQTCRSETVRARRDRP
jgi:hypothetical protein